jgi:hypothetical protein
MVSLDRSFRFAMGARCRSGLWNLKSRQTSPFAVGSASDRTGVYIAAAAASTSSFVAQVRARQLPLLIRVTEFTNRTGPAVVGDPDARHVEAPELIGPLDLSQASVSRLPGSRPGCLLVSLDEAVLGFVDFGVDTQVEEVLVLGGPDVLGYGGSRLVALRYPKSRPD